MKTVSYEPKFNFHDSSPINLRISGDEWQGEFYLISKAQYDRIKRHFCGMNDCSCPKGEADAIPGTFETTYCIPIRNCK